MKAEVVPHNSQWKNAFEIESKQIAKAGGENIVTIHHIGSTSIPKIYAKPIIDFLVEVRDIALVDKCNAAMEALGYEVMGEFGIKNRRYFRKENPPGNRTHHVHMYEVDSPEIQRHIAFRDYLIAHSKIALEYSDLKRKLAQAYPEDIESYMDGKDGFIKNVERKAVKWYGTFPEF